MFHLGRDFVVNDGLLILAHNIYAELKVVRGLEFMWLRLAIFGG